MGVVDRRQAAGGFVCVHGPFRTGAHGGGRQLSQNQLAFELELPAGFTGVDAMSMLERALKTCSRASRLMFAYFLDRRALPPDRRGGLVCLLDMQCDAVWQRIGIDQVTRD